MFLAKKFSVKSHQMARANSLSPTKGKGPFSATLSPTISPYQYSVRTCRVISETRDTEEIIALAPYTCLTKCKPASTSFLVLWRMGRYQVLRTVESTSERSHLHCALLKMVKLQAGINEKGEPHFSWESVCGEAGFEVYYGVHFVAL